MIFCTDPASAAGALGGLQTLRGQKISWPNRSAIQPRGFWQAADQVRIPHGLAGRSLAETVDHAHRDHLPPRRVSR